MADKTKMDTLGNIYTIIGTYDSAADICLDNSGNVMSCPSPLNTDKEGNIIGGLIGVYEAETGKCYDFSFNEIPCPEDKPEGLLSPVVVEAKRSYWWVFLIVLIVVWLGIFVYLNRKKYK